MRVWGSRGRAERKVRNLYWPYQTWTIALDQPGVAVRERMAKWCNVHLADQKFQKDITRVSWSVCMESIWLEGTQGMSCCLFECINKNLSPTQVFGTVLILLWLWFARICNNHNRFRFDGCALIHWDNDWLNDTNYVTSWSMGCLRMQHIRFCGEPQIFEVQEGIQFTVISFEITSSTAQGGGGSFKNRKRIGEIDCCEWRMSEQKHWPTD